MYVYVMSGSSEVEKIKIYFINYEYYEECKYIV